MFDVSISNVYSIAYLVNIKSNCSFFKTKFQFLSQIFFCKIFLDFPVTVWKKYTVDIDFKKIFYKEFSTLALNCKYFFLHNFTKMGFKNIYTFKKFCLLSSINTKDIFLRKSNLEAILIYVHAQISLSLLKFGLTLLIMH